MKVAAVVVTCNRLDLLKRCLDAVRGQTRRPDEIIVVNNGSTDGTDDWLTSQDDLVVVTQDNGGGAGGQHAGIEEALRRACDWAWCMDDDGVPAADALQQLLARQRPGFAALSCLVLSAQDHGRLAFSLPVLNARGLPRVMGRRRIRTLEEARRRAGNNGLLPWANFFNGSLINVEAVKAVGNVNRDMFIRGDETEMTWRLRTYGDVVTVVDAISVHPVPEAIQMPDWKRFYAIRNSLYIHSRYMNLAIFRNLNVLRRYAVPLLFTRRGRRLLLRAFREAASGQLTSDVRPA